MQVKRVLMDALAIERALKRISHEIIENNKGVKNVVMLGIAKGGIPVCEKLASNIFQIENEKIPTAKLDIISKTRYVKLCSWNFNLFDIKNIAC